MRKKLVLIAFLFLLTILTGCKSKKVPDIEKIIQNISSSEQVLTGYTEKDTIKDGDVIIYSKDITFQLERGEEIKTKFNQKENSLNLESSSPSLEMLTKETSYVTIGDKKYEFVNGAEQETSYIIPKYFLTFTLEEGFLEDSYEITKDDSIWKLNAKVKEDSISAFFLNKNVTGIKDLSLELELKDEKISKMAANYTSHAGFPVSMVIEYTYESVAITR